VSVARCREINARLRAAGIIVHEWPGWESRGNGQSSVYEGGLVHHTATGFGSAPAVLVDGRPDLAGPLCNYAGNADGSITVIAAHPANHAGASGGRSMGPLPVTSLFNKRVLGLEIVYPGTVAMRTAQYRTAGIWSRIVVDVCGHSDIQRARAHAETSVTGKWDPGDAPSRTINMAAFRAAALIRPEDDFMAALTDSDQLAMIWRLEALVHGRASVAGGPTKGEPVELAGAIGSTRQAVAGLTAAVAALSKNPDLTPAQVGALLDASVKAHTPTAEQNAAAQRPFLAEVVRAALGEDNADQADRIVDELVSRLANPTEGNMK
jgi:hypothetical protein